MDKKDRPGTEKTFTNLVEYALLALLLLAIVIPIVEYKPWRNAGVWYDKMWTRIQR